MEMKLQTKILVLFTLAWAMMGACCKSCGTCEPDTEPGIRSLGSAHFFPLGFATNNFDLTKRFFAGHGVKRFRLTFKVVTDTTTKQGTWIDGLRVTVSAFKPFVAGSTARARIFSDFTFTPTFINADNEFQTAWVDGNYADIRISSEGTPLTVSTSTLNSDSPQRAQGYVLITNIDYDMSENSRFTNYVPVFSWKEPFEAAVVPPGKLFNRFDANRLVPQRQVHGQLQLLGDRNFYYAAIAPHQKATLYLSHLNYLYGKDAKLTVRVNRVRRSELSGTQFDEPFLIPKLDDSPESGKLVPFGEDTGIYEEFEALPEEAYLFITVASGLGADYSIVLNTLVEEFFPEVEMESSLKNKTPPTFTPGSGPVRNDLVDIKNVYKSISDPYRHAYDAHLSRFIKASPSYLDRAIEQLVLTSAIMLQSTEGSARISEANIYTSTTPASVSDIDYNDSRDGGWAIADLYVIGGINMYLDSKGTTDADCIRGLNNPLRGAGTLNHEWAHYWYYFIDEYTLCEDANDNSLGSKPYHFNSLMGSSGEHKFCNTLNHNQDNLASQLPGEDECDWVWFDPGPHMEELVSAEGYAPNFSTADIQQATYFDVLDKLSSLMPVHVFD